MINKVLDHKLYKKHRELVLYGLIGLSGATLDFFAFVFLYSVLGVNPLFATALSISLGITNNFFLNRHFNFKVKDQTLKRFISFYSVGVFGIFLSILFIFILHDLLGTDANVAKLLSIPPIVLMQYLLNKHLTFGSMGHKLYSVTKDNKWLIILNVIFLLTLAFFIKFNTNLTVIPQEQRSTRLISQQPPDESIHYRFNTLFIIENQRLPVSGKDDVAALSACRNPEIGQVPCLYSYQVYPATPYVISAIFAKFFNATLNIQLPIAARLPGLLYGFILLNFLYLAILRIVKIKHIALLLVSSVVFIPQVIYTLSYLNLDGFSLAVAAILTYATVLFLQSPSFKSSLLLGISFGGLLFNSKYSFFVLAIPVVCLILYKMVSSSTHRKALASLIFSTILGFMVLSAPWYIRNYVLYSDFLGQSFVLSEMAKYHPLGSDLSLSLHSIGILERQEFIGVTFRSFFAAYGGMLYFVSSGLLDILGAALFGLGVFSLYRGVKTGDRKVVYGWALVIITITLALAVSMYNSMLYDFQAQGRYIFPALFPAIIFLAYQYARDQKAFRYIPLILATFIAYTFFHGLELFIRIYA